MGWACIYNRKLVHQTNNFVKSPPSSFLFIDIMKKINYKFLILILSIFFVLFIFHEGIVAFLSFKTGADDLSYLPYEKQIEIEIKNRVLKSSFGAGNVVFNFMSGIGVFAPLLLIVFSFNYNNIKIKHLKFNIGKNNTFFKKESLAKIKYSLLSSLIIILVLSFSLLLSLLIGEKYGFTIYSKNLISESCFQKFIFANEIGYVFFLIINLTLATFFSGILLFYLTDKFGSIKASIFFLVYIWIFSIILYSFKFIPKFIVPMDSFMGVTRGNSTIFSILLSNLTNILLIILFKIFYIEEL